MPDELTFHCPMCNADLPEEARGHVDPSLCGICEDPANRSDLIICPECGGEVWDVASGHKLHKCWNTSGHKDGGALAFDTPAAPIDVDGLNDAMEMDHVVMVRGGKAYDVRRTPYAPECYWEGFADGAHIEAGTGWDLMDGYSGQYGYSGPIMHASEYIGGRMADDILATDGYYAAVVCDALDDEGDEPAGWAVARRDLDD